MKNIPPFKITANVLKISQEINYKLGVLSGAKLVPVPIKLRRDNKIKTIHASLSIEGNTLSLDQVTSILENKKVIGPKHDIQEVNNAINVYSDLTIWKPLSIISLKKAHKILLKNLIITNGEWRQNNVGIFQDKKVVHVAPPSKKIPSLMQDLFLFIKNNKDLSWLIKSCIYHYEFEFIHPFQDGNGRMGRLWQQLLLIKENPIFEFICIESIIKSNQQEYYKVLGECDEKGESTLFIEFSLETISFALDEYIDSAICQVNTVTSRLEYNQQLVGKNFFSRNEYIKNLKNISTATASRDLIDGVKSGILEKTGSANQTKYNYK